MIVIENLIRINQGLILYFQSDIAFKKNYSEETHMNGSSHPNHENRKIIISTVLIRRGGAPSGAAAFIIFGGMGVSTPISQFRKGSIFMGNHSEPI